MAAKTILPLLAIAGVGAVLLIRKKPAKKKKKPIPEDYLTGYFAPGATLGAAEAVIADIEKPITLTNIAMRDRDGNMHEVSEATFAPDGSAVLTGVDANLFTGMGPIIGRVVTNFYGPGAVAFEGEVIDEFIEGPVPADPKDPEAAPAVALAVLQRLRTRINWSTTPKGSAERMVLDGAVVISKIVHQQLPGA
jgi:hypothetical protein